MHRPTLAALVALLLAVLPPSRLGAAEPSASPAAASAAAAAAPFELKDGDRVLFVGGTFVEREGHLGYIEAALTARFPGRKVTFRNLGQSGDTVKADARNLNAGWVTFGPPDQGFERLKKLVGEIKPTVVIANYGMTESFAGPAGAGEFAKGYDRLLDMVVAAAGSGPDGGKPRVVLLSPNYHEDLGKPLPETTAHNTSLRAYRDAVKDVAGRRGARFVDLFAVTEQLAKRDASPKPLTDAGLHPTPEGYKALVDPLLAAMNVPPPPAPVPPEKLEALRGLVVAKNAEYFNYWRPQNDTYILGYRKKEQGRNAVEIPQFLPLVEAKEQEIAAATGK
ncbi:MAG: hypothetical protein JWO31_3404 [Phycisphaerales bacterium]|nr:hypothetical protein [Phycisphaerales bacterium]